MEIPRQLMSAWLLDVALGNCRFQISRGKFDENMGSLYRVVIRSQYPDVQQPS